MKEKNRLPRDIFPLSELYSKEEALRKFWRAFFKNYAIVFFRNKSFHCLSSFFRSFFNIVDHSLTYIVIIYTNK